MVPSSHNGFSKVQEAWDGPSISTNSKPERKALKIRVGFGSCFEPMQPLSFFLSLRTDSLH